MNALPVAKTAEIISRINALHAPSLQYLNLEVISPEAREFWQLSREIELLLKVDACAGWEAHGALKALTGDCDAVKAAFQASFALGNSGSNRINWIVSCVNMGMFYSAFDACVNLSVEDTGFLAGAQRAALKCGALAESCKFAERAMVTRSEWDKDAAETVTAAIEILRDAGISDEQVARQLDLAGNVLRRHALRPLVIPRVTSAEGFFRGVTYALPVPVSSEEAFDMNAELAVEEAEARIQKDVAFDVVFEANAMSAGFR